MLTLYSDTKQVVNNRQAFGNSIDFNFCEAALKPEGKCTATDSFAFITTGTAPDQTCYDLKEAADQKADTFALETRDDDGEVNGVSLNFHGGSQ